jgi:hypothetical protein
LISCIRETKGRQMKKVIFAAALLLITPTAIANEIPGTRVAGQGAVCGEGEGKALEVNASTKQEWSYCFKREVIVTPIPTPTPTLTPTPTPTPAPTQTTESTPVTTDSTVSVGSTTVETTTVTSDSSTVTVAPEPTPTPTPTPTLPALPETPERSNVIIADVTAKTVTVREETIEEWLGRILAGWTLWYQQLQQWFASLGS